MGLDQVELIIATEAAFGVQIPDADAATIATPRQLIDYLAERLPAPGEPVCLTQRAFYRTRAVCSARFGMPRAELHPTSRLADVLPRTGRRAAWHQVGVDLGAERWPTFWEAHWIGRRFGMGPQTLGDVAVYLATWYPARVRGPDAGWTRTDIERTFIALLEAETGIDMRRHSLDARFSYELGLD